MAKTIGITSTPENNTPAPKKINWPDKSTLQKYFRNGIKLLGRIGAGAIILFALADFVPELRVEMPNFYRLVDFIINAIEWAYTKFWAIVT